MGVRGITLDDVANVAANGSSAMRGGYTFTRPQPQPFGLNVKDVLAGMVAQPLNTAGQKYSGFPTAEAQKAAILGSIEPFYALGEYARQLAEQRRGEIGAETASDVRRMYGPEMLQQTERGPIAIPGVGNVAPAQVARGNVADPAYQAAELAANQAFRDLGIAKALGGLPDKLREYQELLDSGFELEPGQQREYRELWRQQRGTAQDIFAKEQAAEQAQAALALASRNATSARLARATGRAAQAGEQVAQEVAPGMEFAADVASTPRYELARQMATGYFGMDPALAYGTFTPQVDINYMNMMQDLKTAQNLARGIDPNASVEDTLVTIDPTGQRLAAYQQEMALQKEQALFEGANTAAEDQFDANLEMATGISVKQAAGDLPLSTARGYLSDRQFMEDVQGAIASLQEELPLGMTAGDRVNQIAAAYVAQGGAPVAAVILANIIATFAPVIPAGG